MLQQKSSRPPIPISNATKRSFMASLAASGSAEVQPTVQPPLDTSNRYFLHCEESESLSFSTLSCFPFHEAGTVCLDKNHWLVQFHTMKPDKLQHFISESWNVVEEVRWSRKLPLEMALLLWLLPCSVLFCLLFPSISSS